MNDNGTVVRTKLDLDGATEAIRPRCAPLGEVVAVILLQKDDFRQSCGVVFVLLLSAWRHDLNH